MNIKDIKDVIAAMDENDVVEIFEAVLSNPHVLSGAIATESDVYDKIDSLFSQEYDEEDNSADDAFDDFIDSLNLEDDYIAEFCELDSTLETDISHALDDIAKKAVKKQLRCGAFFAFLVKKYY